MNQKIKLKNLPSVSEQEVFDHVCFHLLSDTERAPGMENMENPTILLYMTGDELKSVPSCFMSKFQYWFKRGRKFCWEELCDQGKVPAAHRDLIIALDAIHGIYAPAQWPEQLHLFALKRGLNFDTLAI